MNQSPVLSRPTKEMINGFLLSGAADGRITDVEKQLENGANINARDKNDNTALLLAVARSDSSPVNYYGMIERLLDDNANVAVCNKDRNTALHLAVAKGDSHTVKLLLERGAGILVALPNNAGKTPLALAEGNEGIKALLQSPRYQTSKVSTWVQRTTPKAVAGDVAQARGGSF